MSGKNKNNEITSKEVLLVSNGGLDKVSLSDAMAEADKKGLDLVQVSEKEGMPICKIVDYSKIRYEEEKKAKKNRKMNKTDIKEIKMSYSIQENDLNIKVKNIARLLKRDSDKVRVHVVLRGRAEES